MADLSILTLTRHRPDFVARLDDSIERALRDFDHLKVQKLLVNNGANARRSGWDAVTHLAVKRNWGVIEPGYNTTFSAGNNLAAKAATGKSLLLVNDDVILSPESLQLLWEAREQAEVLGCLIVHASGTVNHAGAQVVPHPDHIGRHSSVEQWRGVKPRQAVTFACVLIDAGWYNELGGLDERYVYSFEDTDFCMRTMQAGGRVAVQLDAVVTHDECGTRPRGGKNEQANAVIFSQTWPPDRVAEIVKRYEGGDTDTR